ncbi:MAG: DUF1302 domain-containing protein [Deltaproteobacteria bacterium]|nr:DUF1302 domain-containing protein [Deltaproteobacteria bacterium]
MQLDSTISYGLQWRVQKRDRDIIGLTNGGYKHSNNLDDGNLNYGRGVISNAIKMTSDLDISAGWYGAFVRAKKAVGSDFDFLDRYIWVSHEIAGMPFQIRVGDQVVSWGESTFIQNSINSINAVDVSKLRVPGAELKEALTPEGMIWASISLTDNFSIEGFYEYDWSETRLDPPGTYFSTADYVGKGGEKLMLGFGAFPDKGNASVADTFMAVPRGETDYAKDHGQHGIALRYYSEALHNTEFSFYYLRYHNHIPNIQVRVGDAASLQQAGIKAKAAAAAVYAAAGVPPGVNPEVDAKAKKVAKVTGIDSYGKSSRYFSHYEEYLELYGVGFNTEVAGIGWQGEISYRPDYPVQVDDLEILQTFLSPLNPALGQLSQLGPIAPGGLIKGFIEKDIVQLQTTLSYLLPPISWLGSKGGLIIGEVGWEHVCDMPSRSKMRLEAPGTVTPGGAISAAAMGQPATDSGHFADGDSWGYRILTKLEFYNVIGPIGFTPRLAWQHDVKGISPVGGPFLEDRKAITVGLEANYLDSWTADISYTNYFGAGAYNLINDRDFVSLNIKYSF